MSLRARILVLLACATLVPATVLLEEGLRERAVLIADAREGMHKAATHIAREIDEAVSSTVQLQYGLSRARELDTGDRAACSAFLARVLSDNPRYTGLLTIRPDGRLFCDSLRTGRQLDLSDRRYFQNALRADPPLGVEPTFGRLTGKAVLQVAYGARAAGETRFVLLASLDLDRFMERQYRDLHFRAAALALVDAHGTVLTWHPNGNERRGRLLNGATLPALSSTAGQAGSTSALDGVERIWTTASPPGVGTGLSVLLGVPPNEVAVIADRRLAHALWTLAVASVLALAVGWALAEAGIRKPIARIERAIAEFRAGDYSARVGAPYPRGELGKLMRDVDATADLVQVMDAALRRQAETSRDGLEEMRSRFESFMENLPVLAAIRDARGRFVYANAAWREINGIDPAQVIGRTREEVFGGFAGAVAEQDAAVLAAGAPIRFHYAREVRGEKRMRESWKFPLRRDEREDALVGAITFDITASERAEAAVRESEKKYRLLAEALRDGVYRADLVTNRALFVNPGMETLTGYAESDWLGKPAFWTEILHPEDRARVLAHFERVEASGEAGEIDYRIVRRDGTVRWVSDRYSFEHDREGGVSAIVGTMSDVTERVLAMHRIAESDRAKSAFLAAMSHELKTPLTAILGFSSELLRRAQSLTDEERRDLEAIRSSGEALLAMVEDLLDLARIEGGGIGLQLEPTDPALLIDTCVAARREEALRKEIALERDVAAGLGEVRVDPRRFRQMLDQLLGNAIKFTPAGGRVACHARRVAHSGRDWLEVSVSDTGPGIAPQDQAKLFRPFVQVDRALSRRHGGAGLGLAIVRGLAALHGGRAGVRSEPGKGSTFFIHVPLAEAAP